MVQILLREGSYTEHSSTTPSHIQISGEPTGLEYVVSEDKKNEKGVVNRSPSEESVVTISIMFVLKTFLNENKDFDYVTNLLLDGKEEMEFRKKQKLA